MRRQNRYYTGSNLAYKVDDYGENIPKKRTAGQVKIKKTKEVDYRGYIKSTREKSGHSAKIYLALAIIFALSILLVYSAFQKLDYDRRMTTLNNELAEIENENKHLEEKIKQGITDEELKQLATKKLGMSPPAEYQKRYIKRDKQSYVVQYENNNTKNEQDDSGFKGVAEKIMRIVNMIKR